jgi:hypothetical protein
MKTGHQPEIQLQVKPPSSKALVTAEFVAFSPALSSGYIFKYINFVGRKGGLLLVNHLYLLRIFSDRMADESPTNELFALKKLKKHLLKKYKRFLGYHLIVFTHFIQCTRINREWNFE